MEIKSIPTPQFVIKATRHELVTLLTILGNLTTHQVGTFGADTEIFDDLYTSLRDALKED